MAAHEAFCGAEKRTDDDDDETHDDEHYDGERSGAKSELVS